VITVELLGDRHVLEVEFNVKPKGQLTQLLLLGPEQVEQLLSHFTHIIVDPF
jgi:hypothetical protein